MHSFLEKLIAQGEHDRQDFKYKVMDAAKLAKSVSAFANTNGGRLIIGVRDDGFISGVTSEEEVFMMRTAAEKYCIPSVQTNFQTVIHKGKTVLICEVPPSSDKPVCAIDDIIIDPQTAEIKPKDRPTAYVRVDDENIVASPVHLQIWKDQKVENGMVVQFSDDERKLTEFLAENHALPLNRIVKSTGLPRRKVVVTLANLIRFDIVACLFDGKQFLFSLKAGSNN